MNITIQVITPKHSDLPKSAFIKKTLNTVADALRQSNKDVLVRIVNPDEMQNLNKTYRQKDYATNVLSFPFTAPNGLEVDELGDIIICHEVLKTEAAAQQKTLNDHYAHMLVHGFLHLLGYDHIKEADAVKMEKLEIKILQQLNIANPYEEKT